MRPGEAKSKRPLGHKTIALWQALPLLVLMVMVLAFTACRTSVDVAAALPGSVTAAPPQMEANVPTAAPVIVVSDVTPTKLPSFALPSLDELPTREQDDHAVAEATLEVQTLTPTTVAGTAASTPAPTFTPPALPASENGEHYWLYRPVPHGGVVWTDKHYPYGSTRGGQLRTHHGVEFNVPYNTQILAAASGTVVVAGSDAETPYGPHVDFYGNLVVIQHDFSYGGLPVFTLYGHLNQVTVNVGESVQALAPIGYSGAAGVADGPHLHFEVRIGSNSYDETRNPLLWLYPFSDRGTVAGRVLWPDGSLVAGAPVSLNRVDGSAPYGGTTTYDGETVNADSVRGENFVIDDVVSGYYQVIVRTDTGRFTAETWVYPLRTSFIEIMLEESNG